MHSAFILFIYFAFLYFSLSLKWILRRVGNSEGSSQGALGALEAKQTPATAGKQLEQCPPNKPCCSALAPGHAEVSFVSPPQKKTKKTALTSQACEEQSECFGQMLLQVGGATSEGVNRIHP